MSSSEAAALIYNVDCPLINIKWYRLYVCPGLSHDIVLPTRNSVDSVKSSFHPPIISQELKSSFDVKSLLCGTTLALLELCDYHQTLPNKVVPPIQLLENLVLMALGHTRFAIS